jgi:hypothetical protein
MQHPSDDEWGNEESAEHRESCAICRAEHEKLESALAGFRALAQTAAERPDYFWDRQRLAIHDRLRSARRIRGYRPICVLAATAVLVVLGVVVLTKRSQPPMPDFAAGHDQELLVEIERSLNRELPQALQPALVLTQELDNSAARATTK